MLLQPADRHADPDIVAQMGDGHRRTLPQPLRPKARRCRFDGVEQRIMEVTCSDRIARET
jgi:hypothetical protein